MSEKVWRRISTILRGLGISPTFPNSFYRLEIRVIFNITYPVKWPAKARGEALESFFLKEKNLEKLECWGSDFSFNGCSPNPTNKVRKGSKANEENFSAVKFLLCEPSRYDAGRSPSNIWVITFIILEQSETKYQTTKRLVFVLRWELGAR